MFRLSLFLRFQQSKLWHELASDQIIFILCYPEKGQGFDMNVKDTNFGLYSSECTIPPLKGKFYISKRDTEEEVQTSIFVIPNPNYLFLGVFTTTWSFPQIVCPASIVHIISLVCPNIIAAHWFFLADLIQPKNSKTSNWGGSLVFAKDGCWSLLLAVSSFCFSWSSLLHC